MAKRLFLGGALDRTRRTVSDPPVYVVPIVDRNWSAMLDASAPYPSMPARTESYELKRVRIGGAGPLVFVYVLQGLSDRDADWLLLMYIEKGEADGED